MLSDVLPRIAVLERRGAPDVRLASATHDSRLVEQGTLFGAIPGTVVDGHRFIPQALASGASAVLLRDWPPGDLPDDVAWLRVADPRRALALAASQLHGRPSQDMSVFAITGTNGKTTTVSILAPILRAAGLPTGTLGTTGISWDAGSELRTVEATHTTPEGPQLFAHLAAMRDDGTQAVALELSSHALHQGRAAGLSVNVAAWSNLTQDHLDYHGTLEDYAAAKELLITEWLATWGSTDAVLVLNIDDPVVAQRASLWPRVLRVSSSIGAVGRGEADIAPIEVGFSIAGIRGRIATPHGDLDLNTSLVGAHNLDNCLLAGASALAAGIATQAVQEGWATAADPEGRLERVGDGDPAIFVDYAHTPDALRRSLAALRPFTKARLFVVFGCGGDRDAEKRAPMAVVAAAGADHVLVTSDNPRSEDPQSIVDQIVVGLPAAPVESGGKFAVVVDRRRAIRCAVAGAGPGDVILIAGKGHETYQEVAGVKHPFDDRVEAKAALREGT
jgi:UDP-N-acetylmuramoyl-L-alanyl-D-glutamate--2,6-diaminopimelate ligase